MKHCSQHLEGIVIPHLQFEHHFQNCHTVFQGFEGRILPVRGETILTIPAATADTKMVFCKQHIPWTCAKVQVSPLREPSNALTARWEQRANAFEKKPNAFAN